MIVRVSPCRYDPARHTEVVQALEEHIVPALRRLPGFRRYTQGLNREEGRGIVITEWDNLQRAQALRDAIGPVVIDHFADLGLHLEAAQFYEVTAQA